MLTQHCCSGWVAVWSILYQQLQEDGVMLCLKMYLPQLLLQVLPLLASKACLETGFQVACNRHPKGKYYCSYIVEPLIRSYVVACAA